MKLFINSENFQSLKVSIAAFVSSSNVDIEEVIEEDFKKKFPYLSNHKLPVLYLKSGSILFSANAICSFFLSENEKEDLDYRTYEWLEWETLHFQPQVISLLQNHHGDQKLDYLKKSTIVSCLQKLESHLEKAKGFSSKNFPSIADIVLWPNVFLLNESQDIFSEYLSSYQNLQKWYTDLKHQEAFKKATSKVLKGSTLAHLIQSTNQTSVSPCCTVQKHKQSSSSTKKEIEVIKSDNTEISVSKEEVDAAFKFWLSDESSLPRRSAPVHPIVPKEGEKNILITSALPYVNNVPHLGNIIGAVLSADVFARYCRLRKYNTLYICGTDEYGTATETKALEENTTPQEICNKYNALHREIYEWFEISFDYFGRTTTEYQTRIAQDIFWKLHKNQYLLEETTEQLFCGKCERFLADRFVEGTCPFCQYEDARGDQCDKCGKLINAIELKNPKCKVCRQTPNLKSSKHLFLDLPKLEPKIKEHLDNVTSNGHWSTTAKVISYSWLKEGLKPRCITRDLKWGTPVPLEGFTDKVFYVWYDAPIGYPSITGNYMNDWEKWWKRPDIVQLYQFMAKDNVPFHAIIFPACQLGTGDNYTMVNHLAAVEYLNYEDSKFSKSRGVGVFGNDAKDTGIPADIWRFYLLYIRPEGQDTYFSWNDLMTKNNSELLNNLGNYINRALLFITNNFGGVLPEMQLNEDDKTLLAEVNKEIKQYINLLENLRLRDAIRSILNISRLGNQHIQSNKPWELIKGSDIERSRAGTVLGVNTNVACLLSILLEPYMPATCSKLKEQLNYSSDGCVLTENVVCLLPPGHHIGKPSPLFKKIEQADIDKLKAKFAGQQSSPSKEVKQVKSAPSVSSAVNEEIERLNSLIALQGEKVRQLKANSAPKTDINQEVEILLKLKAELRAAGGQDLSQNASQKKKKKK